MANGSAQHRYPIGIQTFEKVRANGYVYVDKTSFIYDLAYGSGNTFFLSRPRRFGKSLLLSTMQAYFEGRRDLFEGLALAGLEREWVEHPVVRVDLSMVKTVDLDELQELLGAALRRNEKIFGRDEADTTPGSRLYGLIQRAHQQSGHPVAVLVDEYDAPLLNVVHDAEKLQAFREVMREFYAPLKACDAWLRFVFLTGITKFSQLSIFSELNSIQDISMDGRYAAICGVSEEELTTQLAPDLEAFSAKLGISVEEGLARLKAYYDGYHFTAESPDIYNPFSLLCALDRGETEAYWFGTGTPTFLINLLNRHGWDIASLEGCVARADAFDAPSERMDTPLPMLYQGGYLTIKDYNPRRRAYTLGIPNEEVSQGLSESLVRHLAPNALSDHYGFLDRFADHLLVDRSLEAALAALRSYLAGIPYHLGSKDEKGFETTFFLIFDLLGIQIETGFKTATGRVDAVVTTNDSIYVMEFKYDKTPEEALAQIDEKGYLLPFATDGRRLVKAGVNFSSESRTVDGWVIAEVEV